MDQIKILIVEYQKIIAHDIKGLLIDWGYHVVGCADTSEAALDLFITEEPDIALVDIHLCGETDGIDTVHKFNKIRPIPIVYLTVQADAYTVERAKASNPSAYLLKPFDERSLQISLELAFNIFTKLQPPQYQFAKTNQTYAHEVKLNADIILQHNDSIFIKQNYSFIKIRQDELILVEADRAYAYIHTKHSRYIVRMTMASVLKKLQNKYLIRVHRSFTINILNIEEFNETEITLNTGKKIPISTVYKEGFLKSFNVM